MDKNRRFSWIFIVLSGKCEIGCSKTRCMPCRVLKNLISSLLFIYLISSLKLMSIDIPSNLARNNNCSWISNLKLKELDMKVIGYLENQNFLGFTRDTVFQCRPNNKIYFQDSSILLLRVPLIRIID